MPRALIESCGLKGFGRGGARVSEKHANFIVNPKARRSASDIEWLIQHIQRMVYQMKGVVLQTEVRIVGERHELRQGRGAARRQIRRARGVAEERRHGAEGAALARRRRASIRSERARTSPRSTRSGSSACSSRCTAASARTARCRGSSNGSAFPTREAACSPRRSPWTSCAPSASGRRKGCRRRRTRCSTSEHRLRAVARKLGVPLMVKPASEGSSVGMSKVRAPATSRRRIALAANYDRVVIAEKFIDGHRAHGRHPRRAGAAGHQHRDAARVLRLPGEIHPNDTRYLIPSGLPKARKREIQALCLKAFRALGCQRLGTRGPDARPAGRPYLLEINTSPGMTDHSLVPMAARAVGLSLRRAVREDPGRRACGITRAS